MQKLRFRRYAQVFKVCHDLSYQETDMHRVFYEKSVNLFVGPQLRKDLIAICYSDYLSQPSLITEGIKK